MTGETAVTEVAPAKINLALHIRRRRLDGYHDIETLFAFARDGDMVTVERASALGFSIIGPFAGALNAESDNLVLRAERAFCTRFGIVAAHRIVLDKRLPIASGIGGGSADAAATLRALARLHGMPPDDRSLVEIATSLGADVPACLGGRTAVGTGRGDELVPIAGLAGTPLLLVNPRVAVSTARVFAGWDGVDRGPIAKGELLARARTGRNDLEAPAIGIAPVIANVREMLAEANGVVLARMSGSGATCFALFESDEVRDSAAAAAGRRGWWTLATKLA